MQNFSTQKIPYIIHKQIYLLCPKLANQIDANLIEKQNSWYQFHMLVINLTRSLKNNPFNFDMAFSFLLSDGTEYYNKKAFFTFLVEKFEFLCSLFNHIDSKEILRRDRSTPGKDLRKGDRRRQHSQPEQFTTDYVSCFVISLDWLL